MNIDWVGVFLNWFPMLLLIGVWVFFIRRMNGSGGYQTKYQTAYMEQMKARMAITQLYVDSW